MVKGYRRNVILLKNTNSDIFDMAYFIIKDDVKENNIDIIGEANRILEENTYPGKMKRRAILPLLLAFGIGMLIGCSIMLFFIF